MTHMPFRSKGETAEWRLIYDRLIQLDVGESIGYDEISDLLGRDLAESRNPLYYAMRKMEETHGRTMENVRKVGYRVAIVVDPAGTSTEPARRRTKGKKSVDFAPLISDLSGRIDQVLSQLGAHAQSLVAFDRRVVEVERKLVDITYDTGQFDSEMTKFQSDLADLNTRLEEVANQLGLLTDWASARS